MKPILAITMGDPAGIGPEICARSLSHHEIYGTCRPLIVGDASIMQKAIDLLDLNLKLNPIHDVKDAQFTPGIADVFDLGLIDLNTFEWGKVQVQCGNAAFQYVKKAIEDLGATPEVEPIRGGTDGARLSYEGLPCPNLSTGGMNAHGIHELVSIQQMDTMVDVIVTICEMAAQRV